LDVSRWPQAVVGRQSLSVDSQAFLFNKNNMLTKQKKGQIVEELSAQLESAKSIILSDFSGLKVKEVQALRHELKEQAVNYVVVKKSLLTIALKKIKIDLYVRSIHGSVAVSFGLGDEVAPARILYNFSRKHDNLKLLIGALLDPEKNILTQEQVLALAKLPDKERLLGQLVFTLNAPVQKLAYSLKANLISLVYILKQKSEKI